MSDSAQFRISVGDDPDHEDLTAEIYFDNAFVALISQEQGLDKAVVELQPCPNGKAWSFLLTDFVDVLNQAKCRLWELRRI